MGSKFNIFHERNIEEIFSENIGNIKSYIEKKTDSEIIQLDKDEIINYLREQYNIPPLFLDVKNIKCYFDDKKCKPAETVFRGVRMRLDENQFFRTITYYIPFSGNHNLFYYKPKGGIIWSYEVWIENNKLCFEIESDSKDPNYFNNYSSNIVKNIEELLVSINNDIEEFNKELKSSCGRLFDDRHKRAVNNLNFIKAINIPVRINKSVPDTFEIPRPEIVKKIIIEEPKALAKYEPEPTLAVDIYEHILNMIHDLGKAFERYPSIYKDRDENSIRDLILLMLQPRYEIEATSETFNRSGKTDILMRYKNSNVFVAECKIWRGKKKYLDGLTQLLNYLTWRDSKSAMIVFVKNGDFSQILSEIKEITLLHENYLSLISEREESWLSYEFKLINDKSRKVRLTVLVFNIPETYD